MHLVDGTRQHKPVEPVTYAEKRNRKHIWKQDQTGMNGLMTRSQGYLYKGLKKPISLQV